MFDCHQAEITVMQFRGHSLPVHQSMSVSWDFLPCPISSAKHAYAISSHNCHWNVSLPSSASLWNGKFGRVEGQNTTFIFIVISTMFWLICPPAFFRCLSNSGTYSELRTMSFIESTGVACSDSISHNQVQVLSIPNDKMQYFL